MKYALILIMVIITFALIVMGPEIFVKMPIFGAGSAKTGPKVPRATKTYAKVPESKFESMIRHYLEALFGKKFPLVHPPWLHGLELDGYNEELNIAFEAQGPLHYKYVPRLDKSYEKYLFRVKNDEKKVRAAQEQGVYLIIVDYTIPKYLIGDYLKSRIYDGVASGQLTHEDIVARFREKPFKYIAPSEVKPAFSGVAN